MKRTTLIICVVTALLIALSAHKSNAQIDSFWVGIDTTGAMSYEDIMTQTFGNLTPTQYPSGILLNRVPGISKTRQMDGTVTAPVINTDEWLSIYDEMYWSFVNRPTGFLHITDYYEQILDAKVEHFAFDNASVVPIGVLHFDYHDIKANAVDDNLIEFNQQLKGFVNTSSITPFDEKTVFAASPMDIVITGPVVHYVIDAVFLKTNVVGNIAAMEIDFGDGAGLQQVNFGNVYTVNYSATGQVLINTKITYASGDIFNCTSKIDVESGGPSLSKDCPTECKKCDEGTASTSIPNPKPDYEVDFTTKDIPKGKKDENKGDFGIYYGCTKAPSNGIITKPVIIVTGFSPHLVVDGCDDPTFGFFYCNFNESGLLDDLRAKDFDIIIVRFRRGVDYVQNNTVLLIDMIDYINFEKETNGSHAENIVIGYSQGDLIAKYALAKMEKEFDFATIDQTGAHHSKLHVSYEGEHQGANTVLGMQHSLEGIVTVAHPLVILFGLLTVLHIAKQTYNSPAAKQLSVYHNSKTGNNKSPGQGQHSYRDDFESDLALTAHGNTDANKIGYPAFARNIGISSGSSIGSKMYNDDVGTNWEGMRIFKNTIVWAPLLSFLSPMSTKYAYFALNSNGDNPVYKKNYQVFGISLPPIRKTTSDPLPYDNAPGGWDGQLINAYTFAHLPVAGISLSPFIALDGYPEDCIKPVCGCFKECFTPTVSILDIKNKTVGSELIYNLATKGLFYNAGTPSAPLNTEPWGYPHLGHKNHYAVTPFDAVAATTTNDRHVKFEPPEFRNFLMGEIAPDDLKLQNRSIGKYQLGYVADFEATRITSGKNVTISTNEEDFVIEDQSTVRFRAGKEIILMPGFSSLNGSDFRAYIDLGLFSGSGCTPSPACKLSNSDKDKSGGRNAELSEPLEEKDDEQVLEEIKEPFSASIFPNPNSGQFTVKCAFQDRQSATLTIINLMGEYVYENQLNQTTSTIDISPHPKGVYFVKIVSGDEIIVKKVVYQ